MHEVTRSHVSFCGNEVRSVQAIIEPARPNWTAPLSAQTNAKGKRVINFAARLTRLRFGFVFSGCWPECGALQLIRKLQLGWLYRGVLTFLIDASSGNSTSNFAPPKGES